MYKLLAFSAITGIFLSSCKSASSIIVGGPTATVEVVQKVPESQKQDYMRILGDLRWDRLTSKKDWLKRFPNCHHGRDVSGNAKFGSPQMYSWGEPIITNINIGRKDCGISVGGVEFIINMVLISEDRFSGKSHTESVLFVIPDKASRRAFRDLIMSDPNKYHPVMETDRKRCSKYSCFQFNDGVVFDEIKPTSHTTSILDGVSIDPSKF